MGNGKKFSWILGALALLILFLLPLIIPQFWICLMTEILILGLAGMALNLLLGYGGSLPFGQSAFYATGAYATAILLTKTAMPQLLVLFIAPFIAAAVGAVFALLLARLYRFYYALMTTAFSMLVWTVIRKWSSLTRGDNGITGVEFTGILNGINNTYLFTLVIVLCSIAILWVIINSPFGWTLRAIRENPNRIAFAGINVVTHRFIAFVISSFFTGVAGALYVVYSHSTFPDFAYWVKAADIVTITILGGMFYFLGPLVGATALIFLQTWVTSVTFYWPLILGIIICIAVLVMPDGLLGIWKRLGLFKGVGMNQPHE